MMMTDLTPVDKIRAAYFYHVVGLTQAQIAVVLNVTNHGRVNEGIKLIEKAVGLSDGGYKDANAD